MPRVKSRPFGRGQTLSLVALCLAVGMAVVAAAGAGAASGPTRGPIPPAAFQAGGAVDPNLVPDFVPALGHDGNVVGYVPKEFLIQGTGAAFSKVRPVAPNVPVYKDDLQTLVGYMVPGRGFVPLGVDPASIPTLPAQALPAADPSRP